jgi:hypothetical protein
MDVRNAMVNRQQPPWRVGENNGLLQKLELRLQRRVSKSPRRRTLQCFLVGESATAPSFHVHELLEQYTTLATFVKQPSYMLGCFSKYHGALDRNLERSGSSLRSVGRRSKLPCNGRSANEQ